MSEKRNTPADAATPEGAEMDLFHVDSITARPPVSSLLRIGKEQAVPAHELAEVLGIDPRQVTLQVNFLRLQGVPICATSDSRGPGYYYPAGPGELAAYTALLRRRILAVRATLEAQEKALDAWTGQLRFKEV